MRTTLPTKSAGIECNCWDYTFHWTDLHQPAEQLRSMIYTYDSLADECLQRLNEISPSSKDASRRDSSKVEGGRKSPHRRDTYALLREHSDNDPKLRQLWAQVNSIPEWVDWDQIRRGQDVFYRYGLPILNALNFESLLGGMGAGRVVETLARTGGFSVKVARRRMLETLQHVLQVTGSLGSIKPGGDGHAASIRVRLLHAAVRRRIMSLTKQRPEYYNVEKFGIPINDLDCIATINSFSATVIWIGLPRQGIRLRDQEIDDYIALWRLVAYYMGSPTYPFETRESSRATMESLLVSEIEPTAMSKVLARNIILSLENTPPTYASRGFMEAMARRLNGGLLSDRLDIPAPNIYYRLLIYGYCVFVIAFAYAVRIFPSLDKRLIAVRRKRYHKMITDDKIGLGKETLFEFKYVPNYSRTTRLGKRKISKPEKRGIEMVGKIGLFAAIVAVTIIGLGFVILLRLLRWNLPFPAVLR